MNLDLYIDLELRKLVAGIDNPGPAKLPPLIQGDTYQVALHFLETVGDSGARVLRRVKPSFGAIKLGLGYIDAPPTGGTWTLSCDGYETTALGHAATKAQLQTALNALTSVTARGGVTVDAGGAPNIYRVRWNNPDLDEGEAALEAGDNQLSPHSFIRVSRYETERGWLHIVKACQSPIAFTDQFYFPAPPAATCASVRTGTGARNAVAALTVPDGATGSLDLTWSGLTTEILPVASLTASTIQTALNNLFADGVRRFAVTQPRLNVYYIEAVGPLALAPQDAPTVTMHDQEQVQTPVAEFSLDVPGAEFVLDGKPLVKDLTLECEVVSDGESITLFQQKVPLYNDMIDTEMALVADPHWLDIIRQPVATVDYDPDQAVIGMLGYQDFAGDAVASVWTYTHNLDTLNVHITVRDNVTGLRIPDNTYTAEILNAHQVRITFPAPPDEDQYVVIISAANAEPHYQPHQHPISEIEGLQAALDALSAAGNPLELWPTIPLDKLPMIPASKLIPPLTDAHIPSHIPRLDADGYLPLTHIPPEVPRLLSDGTLAFRSRKDGAWTTILDAEGRLASGLYGDFAAIPGFTEAVKKALSGGASEAALAFYLPSYAELYPGRAPAPQDLRTLDAAALPKPGGLLPAVHNASVTTLSLPGDLPDADAAPGAVYLNDTGADLQLLGGLGRRSSKVPAGGHLASDGRLWYRVRQQGSTTSYHPVDFERELLVLDVNDAMLADGGIFTLSLILETQLLRTDIRAQWQLVIEAGAFTGAASPAGLNISDITWSSVPLIAQRIHLTKIRTPHTFGVRITRDGSALAAESKLYRAAWATAPTGSAPAALGFAIRARLINFDTEDSLSDPRGYVLLNLNPEGQSLATIV